MIPVLIATNPINFEKSGRLTRQAIRIEPIQEWLPRAGSQSFHDVLGLLNRQIRSQIRRVITSELSGIGMLPNRIEFIPIRVVAVRRDSGGPSHSIFS